MFTNNKQFITAEPILFNDKYKTMWNELKERALNSDNVNLIKELASIEIDYSKKPNESLKVEQIPR